MRSSTLFGSTVLGDLLFIASLQIVLTHGDAFGDLREFEFDKLHSHLLGIDETISVFLEILRNGLVVHVRLRHVFFQRQYCISQFPLLSEQGNKLVYFRWHDETRPDHPIVQLSGRERLSQPLLKYWCAKPLVTQQALIQFLVESTALLENRQRQDCVTQLLVADPQTLIAGDLIQYPFVDQLSQHILLHAGPFQQRGIHLSAQYGLHPLTLLLISPLKFLKGDLTVTHHSGIHRTTPLEIVIDTPNGEGYGQQSDDGISKPTLGMIADFL